MPSSKLASRIPHSGGVSHTLFLLEFSTQSNPEGSNLVSLAATVVVAPMGIDRYEIRAIRMNKILGLDCFVSWGPVLLKSPFIVAKSIVGPWDKMRDTVDGSISRNRAISRTPFPFSCALIMADLNSFILTLKTKF